MGYFLQMSSAHLIASAVMPKTMRVERRRARGMVKSAAKMSTSSLGALDMIDTFDRPGDASCATTFAEADAYTDGCEDKAMKRIPKAGAYAAAGVFHARAEWSICEASAMGPNVGAAATASLTSGAGAFVKAELASASASAGPLKATVGLSIETGASISPLHVEAKFLGTGFSFGKKMGFSVFGSGFEINLL